MAPPLISARRKAYKELIGPRRPWCRLSRLQLRCAFPLLDVVISLRACLLLSYSAAVVAPVAAAIAERVALETALVPPKMRTLVAIEPA